MFLLFTVRKRGSDKDVFGDVVRVTKPQRGPMDKKFGEA